VEKASDFSNKAEITDVIEPWKWGDGPSSQI
jgi:hypothetical protein